MELTFIWSWLSFFAGVVATLLVSFVLMVFAAFKQWKKQKQKNEEYSKAFSAWGGRDNSN